MVSDILQAFSNCPLLLVVVPKPILMIDFILHSACIVYSLIGCSFPLDLNAKELNFGISRKIKWSWERGPLDHHKRGYWRS